MQSIDALLPALHEAIEERRFDSACEQGVIIQEQLNALLQTGSVAAEKLLTLRAELLLAIEQAEQQRSALVATLRQRRERERQLRCYSNTSD